MSHTTNITARNVLRNQSVNHICVDAFTAPMGTKWLENRTQITIEPNKNARKNCPFAIRITRERVARLYYSTTCTKLHFATHWIGCVRVSRSMLFFFLLCWIYFFVLLHSPTCVCERDCVCAYVVVASECMREWTRHQWSSMCTNLKQPKNDDEIKQRNDVRWATLTHWQGLHRTCVVPIFRLQIYSIRIRFG